MNLIRASHGFGRQDGGHSRGNADKTLPRHWPGRQTSPPPRPVSPARRRLRLALGGVKPGSPASTSLRLRPSA
jgi:hypothetical protein